MNIIEHRAPMLATDTDIPKIDDARLKPFLDQLVEHGICDRTGKSLKACTLRRGMELGKWVWQIEWE